MVWKTSPETQQEAIIIAIPERMIREMPGGRDALCRTLENIHNTEDNIWPFAVHGVTEHTVLAYIAFEGKIRYRMSLVGVEENVTRKIDYGGSFRMFYNKDWILLSGPAVKAPYPIPYKGYFNYRWTHKLF